MDNEVRQNNFGYTIYAYTIVFVPTVVATLSRGS